MIRPSTKLRAVKFAVEERLGCSTVAGRALGLARSSYYRVGQLGDEPETMRQEILPLSEKHPPYGYRRITAMMRRDRYAINERRVFQVQRERRSQSSQEAAEHPSHWVFNRSQRQGREA